jgi:hypothetical protein
MTKHRDVGCAANSVVIKRLLAEGGFSYVYLVKDHRTDRMLALKKMICQSEEQVRGSYPFVAGLGSGLSGGAWVRGGHVCVKGQR